MLQKQSHCLKVKCSSSCTGEGICIVSPEFQNLVLCLYSVHVRTKIKWRKNWKKPFASLEAQWELRVRITPRINQFTREYGNARKWWYCNKVFIFFFISSRNFKKRARESLGAEVAWRGNDQDGLRNAGNGGSGVLLRCVFMWNSFLSYGRGRERSQPCEIWLLSAVSNEVQ